jgi:hypothetical protein
VQGQAIGFVEVRNSGAYMLRFNIVFSSAGIDVEKSSTEYPMFESQQLMTPNGVNNIRLTVEYLVFIGVWKTLFQQTLPSTSRCYETFGTVFNPTWLQKPC